MPKRKNLVNNVYGDFTVVEMLYKYKYSGNKPRTYCRCIDENGDEYIIRMDALTSGLTKHTRGATKKKKDLTMQKFGLLTALYDTNKRACNGNIIWHCKCDCGNECDVASTNLITGHTRSCGCRHQSKWEVFIKEYLLSIDIKFEEQKRFRDCVNKKGTDMLPFDFYLPDENIIIEYDGEHHFSVVEGWGGNEKLDRIIENDKIKNKYCLDNNIKLLRIPYTKSESEIIEMINCFIVRRDYSLKGND